MAALGVLISLHEAVCTVVLNHFWLVYASCFFLALLFVVWRGNAGGQLLSKCSIWYPIFAFSLAVVLVSVRFRWCEMGFDTVYPRGFPYPDYLLLRLYELFPPRPLSAEGIDFEGNFNHVLLVVSIPPLIGIGLTGHAVGSYLVRTLRVGSISENN